MPERDSRPSAEAVLRDVGGSPTLTVYLAAAPGAGKTRRLLEDGIRLQEAGRDVAIGWIETKGRPDLEGLAAKLRRISPRTVHVGPGTFEDFDFDAAVERRPDVVLLDELAHDNLAGGRHAKRWQDASALRATGISVIGALNIAHLETVAPVAERLTEFPVREVVPFSFLRDADQVIAIDVSPEQFEARLRAGSIVRREDVERALAGGVYRRNNLEILRSLMMKTIDELTVPDVSPNKTSTALAIVPEGSGAAEFARAAAALAHALDLRLELASENEDPEPVATIARELDAAVAAAPDFAGPSAPIGAIKAAVIVVPRGKIAISLVSGATDRDVFVLDPQLGTAARPLDRDLHVHAYAQTAGDRFRIGHGRLTIYLGAAAGAGKTYAMLDRAHQLVAEGVDVVAALVETHGRADTMKKLEGLELLPLRESIVDGVTYRELDREALLERRPQVALIDELAHTNAPGTAYPKRYEEILGVLRAGISVMTTLNVQHLEGLGDAVYRLTGQHVRETVPDDIVQFADDLILIDATPEVLRERLRAGKIYPPERAERALANFFKVENLAALRELALREVVHARSPARSALSISHLFLGVKARERDTLLIERCARLARRLEIDVTVVHVSKSSADAGSRTVDALRSAADRTRSAWRIVVDKDAARALIGATTESEAPLIAIEGAHSKPRWPRTATFARRLTDAGARQLLVMSPPPVER